MTRVAALVALACTACVDPSLQPCGALVCPADSVCLAEARCATTAQIAACRDHADGETCALTATTGRCVGGACVATVCGNGVVDPGEACDDGNVTGGDGCSADCTKLELCGDGILDEGERCDDGNANPADGCDRCVPTTWIATAVVGSEQHADTTTFLAPADAVFDRSGNLYIADITTNRVSRIDPAGVVSPVAGTGTSGFSGDGGPAVAALLAQPSGLAVDNFGNLYIADTGNARVRRVAFDGTITTFAGSTRHAHTGDGGQATSATLSAPVRLAADPQGGVYITDPGNHDIRYVGPDGVISTVAGTGASGSAGDGGFAVDAELVSPTGIAVGGAGDYYIADALAERVRHVTADGKITTVAGTGASGNTGDGGSATLAALAEPQAVALDAAGALYIGSTSEVRRVGAGGTITTIAGTGSPGFSGDDGPATAAQLARVAGLRFDGSGALYVVDESQGRVRRIDGAGTITTIAGQGAPAATGAGGAATNATLGDPQGVVEDDRGGVYIANEGGNDVLYVAASGLVSLVAGTGQNGDTGDGGPAVSAQLDAPTDVVRDADGALYIAEPFAGRIRRVDPDGTIRSLVTPGDSPGSLALGSGGTVYYSDLLGGAVRRIAGSDGGDVTTIAAGLDRPGELAVDAQGDVFVTETGSASRVLELSGTERTLIASLPGARGVALGGGGELYLLDATRVHRLTATGSDTIVVGTGGSGDDGDGGLARAAELSGPQHVAVGAYGALWIPQADGRIRHVDPRGRMTTPIGDVDPAQMGPLAQARLPDPKALVELPGMRLVAGGTSGTVEAVAGAPGWVSVVAGRYPTASAIGARARFRGAQFGDVDGLAYDAAARVLYLAETSEHRIDTVHLVDPARPDTWTLGELGNPTGTSSFHDGPIAAARFRGPQGLFFDAAARQLYIADRGNHAIRRYDLASGLVSTVAGTPQQRGFDGDGSAASAALLFGPLAITKCANGDLFISDTGNNRIRRVAAGTGIITTVLGEGTPDSDGEGSPSAIFPIDTPHGLACDASGNVYATSSTTVRVLVADANGTVDGTGPVETIYGAPRTSFPASSTACLTGLALRDDATVEVTDNCTGLLVRLHRTPLP